MGKDIIARGIAAEALKQASAGGGGSSGGTVSVEVTRTITGNPGTEASVINEGTDTEVRLVFTVPQGAVGPKGDDGVQINDQNISSAMTWSSKKISEEVEKAAQGEGGGIDNSAINDNKGWSSKKTVDALCSPFHQKAPAVRGELVADYPLGVKSYIEPIQDGDGDPSPENVRPIHGATEVKLIKCGGNLLNLNGREVITDLPFSNNTKRDFNGNKLFVGITGNNYFTNNHILSYSVVDNVVQVLSKSPGYGIGFDIPVVPGMQLKISLKKSLSNAFVRIGTYSKDGVYKRMQGTSASEFNIAIADGEYWMTLIFTSGDNKECIYNDVLLTVSYVPTKYEPYHGEIYTQTLPEEVYGGVYEWDTGKLTISWAKLGSQMEVSKYSAYDTDSVFHYIIRPRGNSGPKLAGTENVLSNKCKNVNEAFRSTKPYEISGHATLDDFIYIALPAPALEPAEVTGWLAKNGVDIVYQIKAPKTAQLQKQEILSQPGVTTVYSNSGDTEIIARENPVATISNLQTQIDELKKAIISTGGNV